MAKNKGGKHHDKKNDDNNELNDAVENIATPDEGTGDHRGHDRQNLQSTVAAATATGAESSDLADEINAAMNENPSGAGRAGGGGQRRAEERNANDDDTSQGQGSNKAVQEPIDNGRDNNENNVAGGSEPQSVGGNTSQDLPSGSGNDTLQSKADISSEQQNAGGASGGRGGQARNQEFDTATTSETFEVDVADATAADLSVEDEFDTKSTSETIEIQVDNVNDEVVIDDEIAPMFDGVEDTQIVLTEAELLANASDVDGDDLNVENLSIENATFEIEIDPETSEKSFVVTPNENINGELKVTFDVSDQNGSEVASGATLNVAAVNDAAIVTPTEIGGTEDTAITFTQEMLLQNASDIDSDELTALNLSIDAQYGSVIDNGDGTFTFTPMADYNGDVPFTFDVDDNDGAVTPASGNLDIAAVNDVPVLVETSYEVNEDGSIVITEASLLNNATDVDNDVLSVASITSDEHGTVIQNDNGDWVYTPNADYSGDANLTITLNDGTVDAEFSSPVTVTLDADVPSLTVSLTDMTLAEYGVGQDSALTGWHTDNHNNHIEIHQDYVYGVGDNRGGVIELEANRGDESNLYTNLDVQAGDVLTLSFDMSARLHYEGTDSQVDIYFEGVLIDSLAPEDAGWESHTYQLTATTDNPRLEFDSPDDNSLGGLLDAITVVKDIIEDQAVPIAIDSAALDADDSESLQSIVIDNLPDGATLTDGINTFTASGDDNSADVLGWDLSSLIFQGAEDFNGSVSLEVTATTVENSTLNDEVPEMASTTSKLDFEVQAVNDAVVIDADSVPQFNTDEDAEIIITEAALLANASDVDGDNLLITNLAIDNATFKTVIDSETGDKSFIVTPNQDVNGDLDITFNVSDQNGSLVASDGTLTVEAVNDVAVVNDKTFTINEDGTITFTDEQLLLDASDVDHDDLTVDSVTYGGSDGVFTDHGDGTYTFAPNENFNGDVDLSFTVSDGTALTPANIDIQVEAVNDPPVAGSTSYSVNEDGILTFTDAQLLANSSDIEGEVSIDAVTYSGTDGILTNNGNGTYSFAPNPNFEGGVAFDVTVKDQEGTTATTTAEVDVVAVNDTPVVAGNVAYNVNEDGTITLTQEQLLMHASDVDGDDLIATNLQLEAFGSVEMHEDASFTITPAENFNGDLQLTFDVTDGQETVSTGLDLTVNPVNDPVIAQDDSSLDGMDPLIRLDAAPEHGSVQYLDEDGEWADMVIGLTYPADTQVQFTPNTEEIQSDTRDIRVGSFDSDTSTRIFDGAATVEDWGTVDGDTAVYVEDGVTITTQVNTGELAAWNGAGTHKGAGIGNESRNGLDTNEMLTVTVEGEDVNQITFQLDGLGGYFDETSSHATEVTIKAFDADGNLIDAQGGYRDSGEYQDTYAFTTDVPVHHFTLGTTGSNGTYVVQNMTVSRTMSEEIQMTTIQSDGSEISHSLNLDLNHSTADQTLDVTEQLVDVNEAITSRAIEVEEDGQLVIQAADLLLNDSDVDGDTLSISAVSATDDTHGEVSLDADGNVVFTPAADYNGPASFTYTVTDGNGSYDTATVSVNVTPIDDLPVAPSLSFDVDEDQVLVIDPAYILSHASDVDGDQLSLESLSLKQPQNGSLQLQQDGMYHLITPPDFNGLIELGYQVSDGNNVVDGGMKVDVLPVNDAPFNGGNAHLTTYEEGAFTFNANDMLDLFGDIDGDNLVISRIINADGDESGTIEDNEDGTWTFIPTGDYAGTTELQIEVSDPDGLTTMLTMPVFVRPVADGAVITTDHDGPLVFDEDTTGLLGLNVDMIDSSEVLSHLVITGFPVGFEVSDGVHSVMITEPGQIVDVTEWSFNDLSITPPQDFSGNFFITVSATTADYGETASSQITQPTDTYADFDVAESGALTLTTADLLAMADDIETSPSDEVHGVHLIDRSQGELVDNGDGTWLFTPADEVSGNVDFAYQVNHDGESSDVQSSIAVNEADEADSNTAPINTAPSVDAVVTTEIEAGNTLTFNDGDMLAQLSDAQGDTLSIESVQLITGQGVLETNSEGEYTFVPAEGYTGEAHIAFVATDGEESVRSHFTVDINEAEDDSSQQNSDFMLDEFGALHLAESDILTALNLEPSLDVTSIDYNGDDGALVENGDGNWVFWTDDDFNGQLELDVSTTDGDSAAMHSLQLNVAEYEDPEASSPTERQADEASAQENHDTQTVMLDAQVAQDNDVTNDSEADITAAPGSTVRIDIPDDVTANPDVEQVEISNLPEGATISNGILNDDGSYTISGNLSRPVKIELADENEGKEEITFEGQSEIGTPIEGATGTVTIEVDDDHAMHSGHRGNDNSRGMHDEDDSKGDWMQGDNRDQGVDVMDDSASYENDEHTAQQDDSNVVDDNYS
ncbi:tandem-95 repeat protein [Photobacterium indicum]|uniref:tandem-95 repeat protein n=1 Tax=Photobacterium indicum TaxID=81447 RepID=UPI003D09F19D